MDDRPILLLGRGARPRRLGEVLTALARVRAAESGRDTLDAVAPQGLDDLEELLSQRPTSGTLILEVDTVPLEDIGFVRRFLERHPAWHLLLLGETLSDPRARGLLALPRSDWLPWPPDLDQLEAFLESLRGEAPRSEPAPAVRERPERRRHEPVAEAARGGVDVGSLVEERLAGSSLSGNGAPRFFYEGAGPVRIEVDRRALGKGLDGLIALARVCAGESGEVRARAELAGGDGAHIRIEFPLGPLTDGDLPVLLDQPFEGEPALSAAVAAAQSGAEGLRSLGAAVELVPSQAGRLSFEVLLGAAPLPKARAGARRGASAKDPFA